MTSIEKKMLIAVGVCIVALIASLAWLGNAIDEAGGVKEIAVEVGKGVKDVVREVEAH